QVPPVFSAIKINGKRACDRVRLGENVSLTKKNVKVFSLNVVEENLKEKKATFEATCSCGTYIRSLARDMAEKLGSICYVNELRRIESGFFSIKDAILLENFIKMVDTDRVNDVFVPLEKPLDDIPALYLRIDDITKLQNGLCVVTKTPDVLSSNIKILDDNRGGFYGVGYISDYGRVHPIRMCVRK
ncbi:MAG: tRNA pseudouridine(55) synthase TruB, partial [Holosporaceae bacterium]|nr:tRNA pseudouridine(55) synthase TruB [Holosporaceae bacterium]